MITAFDLEGTAATIITILVVISFVSIQRRNLLVLRVIDETFDHIVIDVPNDVVFDRIAIPFVAVSIYVLMLFDLTISNNLVNFSI